MITPAGLARLAPDGRLSVFDVQDGSLKLQLQLGPCVGGSTSGAVVNAPSLPRMLLISEGAGFLAAVDLDSGEVRWRRPIRRSGVLRLRRAGKLIVVAGAEPYLLGLDLLTGEEVWRHGNQYHFVNPVSINGGELYAVATERPGSLASCRLLHIDPWSGALRWSTELPRPALPIGNPLTSVDAVLLTVQDAGRVGVMGFDRHHGRLRFDREAGLCDESAACVVVDDLLVANGENGELVAVSVDDGSLRYRHVFAAWTRSHNAADRPQSFQPVLRAGALFLPQSEVYVVRPRDGALIGRIPDDLIPDVLRVDERCGVYVAEMSGHLAGYAALPSLTLVSEV